MSKAVVHVQPGVTLVRHLCNTSLAIYGVCSHFEPPIQTMTNSTLVGLSLFSFAGSAIFVA